VIALIFNPDGLSWIGRVDGGAHISDERLVGGLRAGVPEGRATVTRQSLQAKDLRAEALEGL
jgi:hypothetical protein